MSVTGREAKYETSPLELAAWLRASGADSLWTVDGDPDLTGVVDFPCTASDLAEELERREGKALVLHGPDMKFGASVGRDEIAALVSSDPAGNRVLQLNWAGSSDVWLLIEDRDTLIEVEVSDNLQISQSVDVELIKGGERQAEPEGDG